MIRGCLKRAMHACVGDGVVAEERLFPILLSYVKVTLEINNSYSKFSL